MPSDERQPLVAPAPEVEAPSRPDSPSLGDRLTGVEAKLIEQEHRLPKIVLSFIESRNSPKGDPRRAAALRALIWKLCSPGTAAVAGGGLVAIASLAVLIWQTKIMQEQNTLFRDQTAKIQTQIEAQDRATTSQRRTEIIASLYETTTLLDLESKPSKVAAANARTRTEAFREFVQLERGRLDRAGAKELANLSFAFLTNVVVADLDLRRLDLTGARLEDTSFSGCDLSNCRFEAAIFTRTNFPRANLRGASFEGCRMNNMVSLAYADLRDCILNSADIEGAVLLGADLRGASLAFVKNFEKVDTIKGANISAVKDAPEGFRDWALKNGAVDLASDQDWEAFKKRTFPR